MAIGEVGKDKACECAETRETSVRHRGVALNSAGPGRVSKTRGKVFDTSPPCHTSARTTIIVVEQKLR